MHIVTGYLKPTLIEQIYPLARVYHHRIFADKSQVKLNGESRSRMKDA